MRKIDLLNLLKDNIVCIKNQLINSLPYIIREPVDVEIVRDFS